MAEADGHLAGFLIALREDATYGSPNFLWFRERYPHFLYIDRIVVAQRYRGLGLGRVFYADAISYAEVRVPLLACEVFLEPRDYVSVLFHGEYGYQEVGQQLMSGWAGACRRCCRDLCSHAFVRSTYLEGAACRASRGWQSASAPPSLRKHRAAGAH